MRKDYVYQDKGQFKLLQNAQRIGGFYAGDQGIVPAEQVLPEQRFAHQPIFRRLPEEMVKSKTYFSFFGYYNFLTACYGGLKKSFIAKQTPTDLAIELMKKLIKGEEPVSGIESDYLTNYYLNSDGYRYVYQDISTANGHIIFIKDWAVFQQFALVNGYWRAWVYGAKLKGWNSFSIDIPFLLNGVTQGYDSQGFVGAGMIDPILLYKWEEGVTNYGLVILETQIFIVYDLPEHPEGVQCVESFLVHYQSVDFMNWGKVQEIFIGSNYPLETRVKENKVAWLSSIIGQRDTSDYSTPYVYWYWLYGAPLDSQFTGGLKWALGESYRQALGEYLGSPIPGDFTARELGASSNFHFKKMRFENSTFIGGIKYLWTKRINGVTKFKKRYLDME